MLLSIKLRQNFLFICMVALTTLSAVMIYYTLQKKWIFYREAEVKFNNKEFQEAISFYKESLDKGHTTDHIYSHLGDAYVAVGNFKDAIQMYKIYLVHHPDDKTVRHSLARAYSWNGDIKEAEQEYRKKLE